MFCDEVFVVVVIQFGVVVQVVLVLVFWFGQFQVEELEGLFVVEGGCCCNRFGMLVDVGFWLGCVFVYGEYVGVVGWLGLCGGQVGCLVGGFGYLDQVVVVLVFVVGDVDVVVCWGGGECLCLGQVQVLVIDIKFSLGVYVVDWLGQIGFLVFVLLNGMGVGECFGFVEVGGVVVVGVLECCLVFDVVVVVLEIEEVGYGVFFVGLVMCFVCRVCIFRLVVMVNFSLVFFEFIQLGSRVIVWQVSSFCRLSCRQLVYLKFGILLCLVGFLIWYLRFCRCVVLVWKVGKLCFGRLVIGLVR